MGVASTSDCGCALRREERRVSLMIAREQSIETRVASGFDREFECFNHKSEAVDVERSVI